MIDDKKFGFSDANTNVTELLSSLFDNAERLQQLAQNWLNFQHVPSRNLWRKLFPFPPADFYLLLITERFTWREMRGRWGNRTVLYVPNWSVLSHVRKKTERKATKQTDLTLRSTITFNYSRECSLCFYHYCLWLLDLFFW